MIDSNNNYLSYYLYPRSSISKLNIRLANSVGIIDSGYRGKSIRSLFRHNGYKLYLVDEFRTSCKCSKCDGGNCKNFMVRKNPKPKKDNLILVHGLLSCKNCSNIWNRDTNSASNIYKISKNAINKVVRPNYLCRKKENN